MEGGTEWAAEKILGTRRKEEATGFHVKWVGFIKLM
jgi:hypothetical protein